MCEYQIHLAAFQETRLIEKNRNPSFGPNYPVISKDRPRDAEGTLTVLDISLMYKEVHIVEDWNLEAQVFKLQAKKQSTTNFYITRRSSCPKCYNASVPQLLADDNAIVIGEAKAHSPLSYSNGPEDNRGASFGEKKFWTQFLHDYNQTRLSFSNTSSSSRYISLSLS